MKRILYRLFESENGVWDTPRFEIATLRSITKALNVNDLGHGRQRSVVDDARCTISPVKAGDSAIASLAETAIFYQWFHSYDLPPEN